VVPEIGRVKKWNEGMERPLINVDLEGLKDTEKPVHDCHPKRSLPKEIISGGGISD